MNAGGRAETMEVKRKRWMPLDNSAKIYPAVMSRDWAAVFRVSVTLKEPIQPEILQQALEDTVVRIPSFSLSLHRGAFWYYLDTNGTSASRGGGCEKSLQKD